MEENQENICVRTTIYLPRKLYESVKLMGIYTHTNVSAIMRVALREKLEKLKGKNDELL